MARSRNAKKGRRSSSKRSRGKRSASSRSSSTRSARGNSNSRGARSATGRSRTSRGRGEARPDDAIALLKADHREVERMFGEFEDTRSGDRKREIAEQICLALRTHTTIEEEIFYPAFLEATRETEIHHEAEIEHAGAKHLIEEIESNGSDDDHFEARISVLKEMIRHHVSEEERRGGMFSKAQSSDMDLSALGQQLMQRKLELMGESADEGFEGRGQASAMSRSRGTGREIRARSS